MLAWLVLYHTHLQRNVLLQVPHNQLTEVVENVRTSSIKWAGLEVCEAPADVHATWLILALAWGPRSMLEYLFPHAKLPGHHRKQAYKRTCHQLYTAKHAMQLST